MEITFILHQLQKMLSTNIEILEYLKDKEDFLGCFTTKKLPSFPNKFPATMMIIVDKHWIALILLKDVCLYFDSFAHTRHFNMISHLLKNKYNYKKIIVNSKVIQNNKSKKCAEFCIAFIKNVNSIESYEIFLNKFYVKKIINDNVVKLLF